MFQRRLATTYTALGSLLIVCAILSAARIPADAHQDFTRLVQEHGGLGHGPDYPDVYRRICAQRRMLQNAYVGVAGLMLLAFGLWGMQHAADREAVREAAAATKAAETSPTKASTNSSPRPGRRPLQKRNDAE